LNIEASIRIHWKIGCANSGAPLRPKPTRKLGRRSLTPRQTDSFPSQFDRQIAGSNVFELRLNHPLDGLRCVAARPLNRFSVIGAPARNLPVT
jgi:hypothetical protein